jgi:hypothetical protein
MSEIPEDVRPSVAMTEGVHLDGYYEQDAEVSDQFAEDATEDGEHHG